MPALDPPPHLYARPVFQDNTTDLRVSLVLDALRAVLRPGSPCEVQKELRACLRAGTKANVIQSNECRAAVASVVYGVSTMRARLSFMLSQCDAPTPRPPAAALLALFLLHQETQGVPDAEHYLPIGSLGLSEASLQKCSPSLTVAPPLLPHVHDLIPLPGESRAASRCRAAGAL